MDPYLVLLAALLLYVLVFGGLSLLRREPLSARFAIEALVVGGVILAFGRLLVGGRVPEAITVLQEVLQHTGSLGIKLEATSRYNLGMAYLKQGQVGRARAQLTEAAELLPGSVCARQARRALKRLDARPEEEAQS